ncbi:MAG: hypothetical protein ACE5FH_03910 [Candidatus Zixiibacteriota bacterium]
MKTQSCFASSARCLTVSLIIAGLAVFGLLLGCSGELIRSDPTVSVTLVMKSELSQYASDEAGVLLTQYQITVSVPESGDIVAFDTLTLDPPYLIGQLDTIPAGLPLRFTAEALDGRGTTVYSGDTITSVGGNGDDTLSIHMLPAVPMLRLAPRYVFSPVGQQFTLQVEAHNLTDLFGIACQIDFENSSMNSVTADYLVVDSAVGGQLLVFDTVIVNQTFPPTSTWSISVTRAGQGSGLLVDSSGNGSLMTLYFTAGDTPSSGLLNLTVTDLTVLNNPNFPLSSVYSDGCFYFTGSQAP